MELAIQPNFDFSHRPSPGPSGRIHIGSTICPEVGQHFAKARFQKLASQNRFLRAMEPGQALQEFVGLLVEPNLGHVVFQVVSDLVAHG